LSSSALTISRERAGEKRQSVVKLTSRKRRGVGARPRQVAAEGARRVEVVERAGDQQVGVGVEVVAELVALVAQVAFDLELDILRRVKR
jgi:nitrogenase subunit NifH